MTNIVKKKKLTTEDRSEDGHYEQSEQFLNSVRSFQYSVPQLRSFLAQEFRRVFPTKPYPNEVPMQLVKTALGYELLVRDYQAKKKPIPDKVQQAHKKALRFETTEASSIALALGRSTEGAVTMKTATKVKIRKAPTPSPEVKATQAQAVKKEAVAKAKKPTVAGTWVALFTDLGNGQKTDQQLAETMTKSFPERTKYTVEDVARHRSIFNNGRFPVQKGVKPTKPAVMKKEEK